MEETIESGNTAMANGGTDRAEKEAGQVTVVTRG